MCGLSGVYSTKLYTYETDIFQDLLETSAPRGRDSTGIFTVLDRKKTPLLWIKDTVPPGEFFTFQSVHNTMKASPMLIAGHNRWATVGKVDRDNSHPFNFPGLIGMHNGTIRKTWTDTPKFGTDSEALYHQIETRGVKEALADLYRTDAYALVFLSKKDWSLNFVRNPLRTLHYADVGGTLYWASEAEHLKWILSRSMKTSTIDVQPFKPYIHYKQKVGSKVSLEEVGDYTPPPVTTYSYGYSGSHWQNTRIGDKPKITSGYHFAILEDGKWVTYSKATGLPLGKAQPEAETDTKLLPPPKDHNQRSFEEALKAHVEAGLNTPELNDPIEDIYDQSVDSSVPSESPFERSMGQTYVSGEIITQEEYWEKVADTGCACGRWCDWDDIVDDTGVLQGEFIKNDVSAKAETLVCKKCFDRYGIPCPNK